MAKNLTWVVGERTDAELDETSRKNLAAGRKGMARTFRSGGAGELAMAYNSQGHQTALPQTGTGHALADINSVFGPPEDAGLLASQTGTSIFDPVLCELAYRWFSPRGGAILDPFAGGSVRGLVAARLERLYTGVELRAEQVAANEVQWEHIGRGPTPRWIVGDSCDIAALAPGAYDFLLTCPPYADLECYSDDPRDLSTMSFAGFQEAYRHILHASAAMLKPDRFACIVIGDARGAEGYYYGLPWLTIAVCAEVGLRLYNDAILVTVAGSLPLRISGQFPTNRKLGKTHQNVLVFCKGDWRQAVAACGPISVDEYALPANGLEEE